MTGTVVLILVCVVGGIVALGVVTQLIERSGRAWRAIAEHSPAQSPAPDATRGEAKVFIGNDVGRLTSQVGVRRGCLLAFMPWLWMRDAYQVRYAVDDEFLHLEIEGGRLTPRAAMSIPWGAIEVGERLQSEMGEYVVLRIGDSLALFPAAAIERELGVRSAGEPGSDHDRFGVDWTEDAG